jgi:hypothetical protein
MGKLRWNAAVALCNAVTLGCVDLSGPKGDSHGVSEDTGDASAMPEVFTQVVVGDYHGCALTNRNRVQCWHPNSRELDFGQADPPDEEFISLAADGAQTCGLTVSGDLECWGVRGDSYY